MKLRHIVAVFAIAVMTTFIILAGMNYSHPKKIPEFRMFADPEVASAQQLRVLGGYRQVPERLETNKPVIYIRLAQNSPHIDSMALGDVTLTCMEYWRTTSVRLYISQEKIEGRPFWVLTLYRQGP